VKLRLCDPLPRRQDAVVLRMAILVVRETDLSFREGGELRHEARRLSDAELAQYRAAWRFAMDGVQLFSAGGVVVESEWIELDGVKLTGLTDTLWKGLVPQRHLDPTRLVPLPEATFRKVARGIRRRGLRLAPRRGGPRVRRGPHAASAAARAVAARACGRPEHARDARELHSRAPPQLRGKTNLLPVHGPRDPRDFARLGIRDEVEWYEHSLRKLSSYRGLRFR
jgi:hypothetical protein